jgi:hypothetical protein
MASSTALVHLMSDIIVKRLMIDFETTSFDVETIIAVLVIFTCVTIAHTVRFEMTKYFVRMYPATLTHVP